MCTVSSILLSLPWRPNLECLFKFYSLIYVRLPLSLPCCMLYDHSLYDNWPYYSESRIWYKSSVSLKYAHGFVESPFCFGWSISGNSIEIVWFIMMTSSNGNIFGVTGHLCGEFTGHRWILHTKASDAERCCSFLICAWWNGWANNRKAGNLRRHRAHIDVIVMVNDISLRMVAGRLSIYYDIPSTFNSLRPSDA